MIILPKNLEQFTVCTLIIDETHIFLAVGRRPFPISDPSALELGPVRLLQPENLEAVKRVVKEEEMPAAPISASNAFNSRYVGMSMELPCCNSKENQIPKLI